MTKIRLEGKRRLYSPKNDDEVRCEDHGVVTTWGALDPIQQLAVEAGLDTTQDLPCILLSRKAESSLRATQAKAST